MSCERKRPQVANSARLHDSVQQSEELTDQTRQAISSLASGFLHDLRKYAKWSSLAGGVPLACIAAIVILCGFAALFKVASILVPEMKKDVNIIRLPAPADESADSVRQRHEFERSEDRRLIIEAIRNAPLNLKPRQPVPTVPAVHRATTGFVPQADAPNPGTIELLCGDMIVRVNRAPGNGDLPSHAPIALDNGPINESVIQAVPSNGAGEFQGGSVPLTIQCGGAMLRVDATPIG